MMRVHAVLSSIHILTLLIATPPAGDTTNPPSGTEGKDQAGAQPGAEPPVLEAERRATDAEAKQKTAEDRAALAEAKQKIAEEGATLAEAKQELAEEELDEAEEEIARIRSGKLIRYGITAGIGPAFHVPLHRSRDGSMRGAPSDGISGLSYLMLHPVYWRNAPQQNLYCANVWAGQADHAAAQRLADESALDRAKVRMELLFDVLTVHANTEFPAEIHQISRADSKAIELLNDLDNDLRLRISAVQLGDSNSQEHLEKRIQLTRERIERLASRRIKPSALADYIFDKISKDNNDYAQLKQTVACLQEQLALWSYPDLDGITADQVTAAKAILDAKRSHKTTVTIQARTMSVAEAEQHLASTMRATVVNWMVDTPGNCTWHRLVGLWVGYALPYRVTVPVETNGVDSRVDVQIKNAFAFGVGISPNAYVSILTGFTVGTVNLPPMDDDDREVVWTWTIGLGGNLDLFTLLQPSR